MLRLRKFTAGLPADARLALLIAALLAVRLTVYVWLAGSVHALPASLCRWDCDWYKDTSRLGYPTAPRAAPGTTFGQAAWAFFPMFPALMAGTHWLLGISSIGSGTVVANLGLAGFVFFAVKYLRLVAPATDGAALAVFLLAWPYSFYLSVPYTEGVYSGLTMAGFWLLARGRFGAASVVAALLSATRLTGVLLTPVIGWHCLRLITAALRAGDRRGALAALRAGLLPAALAPLGLFAFMLYLYLHTGDGLAFIHIQRGWNRAAQNPVTALWTGLTEFDFTSVTPFKSESMSFDALCALAGLLLAARLLRLRRYAACWFLTLSIVLPLTAGLLSMPRYVLAQPLFMVFLFDFIWTSKYRAVFAEIVVVSVIAQLFLVVFWMQAYAFLH